MEPGRNPLVHKVEREAGQVIVLCQIIEQLAAERLPPTLCGDGLGEVVVIDACFARDRYIRLNELWHLNVFAFFHQSLLRLQIEHPISHLPFGSCGQRSVMARGCAWHPGLLAIRVAMAGPMDCCKSSLGGSLFDFTLS